MKESIIIRNVGPLKEIHIGDIRPMTVVIGASGSGKSLLMKIISLMRFLYKRANVRAYLYNSGIKRSPFRIRLESLLHDELKFYLMRPGVHVDYCFTADSGCEYHVEISKNKLSLPKGIDNNDLIFTKESWVSETRNIISMWKSNQGNNRGWLGFFFEETLRDFDEAASEEKRVDMKFVDSSMSVVMQNGVRRFLLGSDGRHEPIELRYASSGIQTAAPLAMLTQYFANTFSFKEAKRRSVLNYLYDADQLSQFHPQIELSSIDSIINIHVEEPELSLDPTAQINLVDEMVSTAFNKARNRMNIIMATHSPYIVNALNLIINRPPESGASLAVGDVGAFRIFNGHLINLMSEDNYGIPLVDTSDLSAPMEKIYDDYTNLINCD